MRAEIQPGSFSPDLMGRILSSRVLYPLIKCSIVFEKVKFGDLDHLDSL